MKFNKYYAAFLAAVVVQSIWLFFQGTSLLTCGVVGFFSGLIYSIGVSRGENWYGLFVFIQYGITCIW